MIYCIYATFISLRHSRDFQPCFSFSPQFTDPPLSVFQAVGPLRLLRCWSQQFLSQRGSWLPVKAQEDRQSWKSWGEFSSWKKAGIMEKRDPFFWGNQTWYKCCWKKNWGIIVQLVWVGHIMNPGNLAWELKNRVILEDDVFSLEQRGWFLGSIFVNRGSMGRSRILDGCGLIRIVEKRPVKRFEKGSHGTTLSQWHRFVA